MTLVCFLGAAVVLSGGVAADGGFEIEINEIPDSVDADGELKVNFTVENTQDFSDTQDVRLTINDRTENSVDNSTSVPLDAGETNTTDLTLNVSDIDQEEYEEDDTITVFVVTEDGDDSRVVEINYNDLKIIDFDIDTDDPVEPNPDGEINYTIEIKNEGNENTAEDIEVNLTTPNASGTDKDGLLDAANGSLKNFDLETGETKEFDSKEDSNIEPISVPDLGETDEIELDDTITIDANVFHNSVDDPLSDDAEFEFSQSAQFDVDINDVIVDGSELWVDVDIENTEDFPDEQQIELFVDGDDQDTSEEITLEGSENVTVYLSADGTNIQSDDSVEVKVASEFRTDSTRVTSADAADLEIDSITPGTVQGGEDLTVEYTADFETVELSVTDANESNPFIEHFEDRFDSEVDNRPVLKGANEHETIEIPFREELIGGHWEVRLIVEDEDGAKASVTETFTADTDFDPEDIDGPRIESITPSTVQGGEDLTVKYTADDDDNNINVTLEVIDPNGDTFENRSDTEVNRSVSPGTNETETIYIPPRERLIEGEYTVKITAKDRSSNGQETAESTFIADTVFNPEDVSSGEVYRAPAGDFVEITLDVEENLDEVYVLIGGDAEAGERNLQNYFDILHIEGADEDLDEARFVINTRLVGTNVSSNNVYSDVSGVDEENIEVTSYAHELGADAEPPDDGKFSDVTFQNERGNTVASTLAEFRTEQLGLHSRSSPLQADRYRIVVGGNGNVLIRDDDIPDFKQAIERANIDLTQPEIQAANTYVLPPGPADKLDRFEDTDVENSDEDEYLETDDLGTLLDQATERETIAQGDRLLIEVQATGMFGALMEGSATHPTLNDEIEAGAGDDEKRSGITNERVATLLERHEGVSIELSDVTLGGANHPGATLQFSNVDESDLYVLPDDSTDQWESDRSVGNDPQIGGFYIVVDTRGSTPFDSQPRHEDELQFEIAYQSPDGERYSYEEYSLASGDKPDPFPDLTEEDGLEHFPYFGSSDTTISANSTIEFLEPSVRYDRTIPDGDLVVPAQEDGRIIGSTNIAPGSDVTIQLIASNRPNPELIAVEDVEIDDDGRFDVGADFSDIPQGERIEVEFYTPGRTIDSRVIDKRGAYVVEDFENPATFEIDAITDELEVEQRGSLSEMRATINNTGDVVDRQTVEFTVENETLKSESVTLQRGQTTTLDLSDRFVTLPAGEYNYTVSTEDDEQTGQLTVTPPDSGTEITSADSDAATSESPLGDDELPGDDTDDGLFAFVGVTSRDVAVATAVAGVVHVLGSFT